MWWQSWVWNDIWAIWSCLLRPGDLMRQTIDVTLFMRCMWSIMTITNLGVETCYKWQACKFSPVLGKVRDSNLFCKTIYISGRNLLCLRANLLCRSQCSASPTAHSARWDCWLNQQNIQPVQKLDSKSYKHHIPQILVEVVLTIYHSSQRYWKIIDCPAQEKLSVKPRLTSKPEGDLTSCACNFRMWGTC